MMEGLRQVALRGDVETLSHIAGVILFSPDLDVDVFREQARTIGELPQPFVIFTSRRDPALALSARITGEPARLGNLRTVGPIADLPVTVIEAGSFRDGTGHFAAATSPALIKLLANALTINAALEGDRVARVGLLPGALLTVQNATQVVLSPAVRILQDLDD
jgi:esterase/lipase superfamily enzyme